MQFLPPSYLRLKRRFQDEALGRVAVSQQNRKLTSAVDLPCQNPNALHNLTRLREITYPHQLLMISIPTEYMISQGQTFKTFRNARAEISSEKREANLYPAAVRQNAEMR
jgi:hypothetical protein